jgi:ketosteroid isomerase-like protein
MRYLRIALLSLLLVVGLGWLVLAAAEERSGCEVEDKIWALEDEYIAAFKNADHDKILAFYHQDFLGWPDSADRPAGIDEAKKFLEVNYARPIAGSFEIERAGIRVFGSVVVTQYVLKVATRDEAGKEQTSATRITHTWQNEGGRWRILGGMSNQQRPKDQEQPD